MAPAFKQNYQFLSNRFFVQFNSNWELIDYLGESIAINSFE